MIIQCMCSLVRLHGILNSQQYEYLRMLSVAFFFIHPVYMSLLQSCISKEHYLESYIKEHAKFGRGGGIFHFITP